MPRFDPYCLSIAVSSVRREIGTAGNSSGTPSDINPPAWTLLGLFKPCLAKLFAEANGKGKQVPHDRMDRSLL